MANVTLYVLFLWQQGKLILMGSLPCLVGVVRVAQRAIQPGILSGGEYIIRQIAGE